MKELLPYVGLIALALSLVNTAYQRRRDQQGDWKKELKDLSDKLDDTARKLLVLETKSDIFFKGVSFSSAQALHSPHTKELDALLEKFQRDELKDERQLRRLKTMLTEIAHADEVPLRRKLALDILTLIRVRYEIGGDLMDSLQQRDRGLRESMDNFSRHLKE